MMKFFYTLLLSSTLLTTINGMEEEKKIDETKKVKKQEEQDFIPKEQDCVSPIIIQQPKDKKELFKKKESYYETKTSINVNTSPRSLKENLLFTAIKNKDHTTLLSLLFLNLNSTDKNGNTALHIAAREGFFKIVKILLTQKQLDLNRKNIGGMTALHLAAQKQYYDIVKLFLKHPGCNSSITTMNGITTVRELIEVSQKNERLKEFTIDFRCECFAYVTLNWEVNKQAKIYCASAITPSLETAVQDIKIDILKIYNEQQEDRNLPKATQLNVTDEFIYQMLKLRIEEFQRNNSSNISSSKSDTQLITDKKTKRSQDNEQSDKKAKHPTLTKKSNSYRDPGSIETKQENSPLMMAVKARDLAMVTELLNLDYNCTDICGNTPLIHAVTLGYAKAVNILLSHPETKPNETNKWGMTAFLIAASKHMESKGHRIILNILILHPAVDASIKNMHDKMAETLIDPTNTKQRELVQNRRQLDEIINAHILKIKNISPDLLTNTSLLDEKIEIIKYSIINNGENTEPFCLSNESTISCGESEIKKIKNKISEAKLKLPPSFDGNFIEQMFKHRIQTSQDIHSIETIKEVSNKKQILLRKTQ